jgi:TctA family transporter
MLNRGYGHLIEITKFCSIPFLISNLLQQSYVPKSILFIALHLFYLAILLIRLESKHAKNISQVLTILPIVLLLVQGVLETNYLKIAVVVGFLMVPISTERSGVPAMHIVLCIVVWLLESARVNNLIRSF